MLETKHESYSRRHFHSVPFYRSHRFASEVIILLSLSQSVTKMIARGASTIEHEASCHSQHTSVQPCLSHGRCFGVTGAGVCKNMNLCDLRDGVYMRAGVKLPLSKQHLTCVVCKTGLLQHEWSLKELSTVIPGSLPSRRASAAGLYCLCSAASRSYRLDSVEERRTR